jgi:hypothetical protein
MVLQASPTGLPVVAEKSPLASFIVQPKRIVWASDKGVVNSENLLRPQNGQATLSDPHPPLKLLPGGSIVLDFESVVGFLVARRSFGNVRFWLP